VDIGDGPVTWRPASIIEIILIPVDIGVWATLVGLCIRERRRLIRTVGFGRSAVLMKDLTSTFGMDFERKILTGFG
jgi:hypothetical protein